jgi:hypothetical protein
MQANEYKVMVLGPRCGKTSFIRGLFGVRKKHGGFPTTMGASVTPYIIGNEMKETHRINFWEVGSTYKGLGKDYCTGMDMAIIFKDNEGRCKEYEQWIPPDTPIIYVSDNDNNTGRVVDEIRKILCKKMTVVSKL